jgi:predicted ATPase
VFKRIEAKGYRCLKEVSQELRPFEILVGSNASGKSTFLDVVGFLSDLIGEGLEVAVERRTKNFHDLVWGREGSSFLLSAHLALPTDKQSFDATFDEPGNDPEVLLPIPLADIIRYSVVIGLDTVSERLSIAAESVDLHDTNLNVSSYPVIVRSGNVLHFRAQQSIRDDFQRKQPENYSSLTAIPNDDLFPAAAWLREYLKDGIRIVALEGRELAKASPPGSADKRMGGANLARQIARLDGEPTHRYRDWLAHVQTALPDICKIDSVLREEDRHRYVVVEYKGGVRVPSWMLSEGTLRLLALTILAYLPDFRGVYLIEEPENGVHPTALETIYQSLSSIYEAQVLVASHSPVLLSMAKPEQILCFSKTSEGTKIVRGSEHPALKEWQGEVSLGTLAASGILG